MELLRKQSDTYAKALMRLEALANLEQMATRGPWSPSENKRKWVTTSAELGADPDGEWHKNRDADSHFVACARNTLPELLVLIREFIREREWIERCGYNLHTDKADAALREFAGDDQ